MCNMHGLTQQEFVAQEMLTTFKRVSDSQINAILVHTLYKLQYIETIVVSYLFLNVFITFI